VNDKRQLTLTVSQRVKGSPTQCFEAWTNSQSLQTWWGPPGIRCIHADLDARVGGRYRIGNAMPDGSTLWIEGEYRVVDKPHKLVFTWTTSVDTAIELVSVCFEACDDGTQVSVTHERVPSRQIREQHELGWKGCLSGLSRYLGFRRYLALMKS
jgi:uncharacterized protein YndB with AHSA1/START domain